MKILEKIRFVLKIPEIDDNKLDFQIQDSTWNGLVLLSSRLFARLESSSVWNRRRQTIKVYLWYFWQKFWLISSKKSDIFKTLPPRRWKRLLLNLAGYWTKYRVFFYWSGQMTLRDLTECLITRIRFDTWDSIRLCLFFSWTGILFRPPGTTLH